jgi:hypothetical protein
MSNLTLVCVLLAIGGSACGSDEGAEKLPVKERGGAGARAMTPSGVAGSLVPAFDPLSPLMCDASITSVSECGDRQCPAVSSALQAVCTVNCCTSDNHCGTQLALTQVVQVGGSVCVAGAAEDSRCPSATFSGMKLPGCCDAQNHCGQILGTLCVPGFPAGTLHDCDAPADAGL